jgi:hypothetical protein
MSFKVFLKNLSQQMDIPLPSNWEANSDEIALAQQVLRYLNEYFFQTYDGIGTTTYNDKQHEYFSDFHKFWESHHSEIIKATINREQAIKAAHAINEASIRYHEGISSLPPDTHGLSPSAIAQVRFFTANQDFRIPPQKQFEKYLDDHSQFDAEAISKDPEEFVKMLGAGKLSQNDKRINFAKKAAEFVLTRNITPFGIASSYDDDASQIRESFLEDVGMGYGRKKTDMFIRDMFVWGVWPNLINMDAIDVASDRNTMKLALRTQILTTDIPLLSSFLDIFGYQYSY